MYLKKDEKKISFMYIYLKKKKHWLKLDKTHAYFRVCCFKYHPIKQYAQCHRKKGGTIEKKGRWSHVGIFP